MDNVTDEGRMPITAAVPHMNGAPRATAQGGADTRSGRRWQRALRTAAFGVSGLLGLVAILAVGGATYEAIAGAGDATAYPAPGRLVDVGGYKLHLDCQGTGSPTVVLDAGLGGSSLDWTLVQPGS